MRHGENICIWGPTGCFTAPPPPHPLLVASDLLFLVLGQLINCVTLLSSPLPPAKAKSTWVLPDSVPPRGGPRGGDMWNIQGGQSAPSRCQETTQHSSRHSGLSSVCVSRASSASCRRRCPLCDSGWGHHAGSRTWAPGSWNSFPRTRVLAHSDCEMLSFTCMDGDYSSA